jgi:hypothetical protein
MKTIHSLFAGILILLFYSCSPSEPEKEDNLPMKVAKAYGYENLDDVNSIAYTWNVQVDSATVSTRDWKWNVKENTVYFANQDTSYTYSLSLPQDSLPPADKGFINDKYWLMYPFQLAWDTGYTFETEEDVPAPISGESTTKLTIIYNNEDGYTPGDAYDLYLDDNQKIKEWVFRRGNGPDGRPITWENEQDFNGITMATEHRNPQGDRVIWFSNIKVE